MVDYEKMFEELVQYKNGINVHSVNVIDSSILHLDDKAKLSSVGLGKYETLTFYVDGQTYCNGTLNQNVNLEGCLVNIQTENGIEQVIFIPSEVPYESSIPPEYQDDWSYMLKLIALAHELGHASDIQRADGNFKLGNKKTVNLVGAEAYANAYALEYLNKVNAPVARNTLARAIYRASSSTKAFEKELYSCVCKQIGKGRLKGWAAA
ncbi:hypothetical protein L1D12_23120 [Vibrio parahaemolyticus]|uniref:hypothetical protein n=1 Tax=Vibrio parahaemolyticus TaxID=670 RepID=UPI001EFEC454|nr:hypothetical protein [Vibrio parahaemolyticus]MCG9638116.1 hypothetical protein [Vibrio parahaemolyticus]